MELNLEKTNLIELHKNLDDFAKTHHKKGGQEALELVKSAYEKSRKERPDIPEYNRGHEESFNFILNILHKKFILDKNE